MRNVTRKELMTLTIVASTVSIISYSAMQEQPKRRTLNQEIEIIKNFFNEPMKSNKQKEKNTSFKKMTVKEIKERVFKRFL